jgi:ParB-like chromosome segregation protein Spo0J
MSEQPFQVMPPLDDEQHHALRQSIQANGVLQPVEVDENGVILDGHHRVAIATELGIDYPTRVVEGLADDAAKRRYATTINVARRQLTAVQRSGYVAQLRMQGLSIRQIAEATGVSRGTVANDLAQLSNSGQLEQPERITGADNKSRPATRPQTPASTPEPAPALTDVDWPARATNLPLSRAEEPADAQPAADPTTPGVDGQVDTVFRGTGQAGEQDGPAVELPSPPARPEPTVDPIDDPEFIARQRREMSTDAVAAALVAINMRLESDPIRWLTETWIPGRYRHRDLPRVRDCFTPDGLRTSAKYLELLADHLDATGGSL